MRFKGMTRLNYEFLRVLETNAIRGYAFELPFDTLSSKLETNAEFGTGEMNTSSLAIQLMLNSEPIKLNEDMDIYAVIKRPDENKYNNKCKLIDGETGAIVLDLKTSDVAMIGTYQFEIVIKSGEDKILISPIVTYKVIENLTVRDEIGSTSVTTDSIKQLVLKEDFTNAKTELEGKITEAKNIATGNKTNITTLTNDVTKAKNDIETLTTTVESLATKQALQDVLSKITTLEGKVITLEEKVTALEGK